MNWSTLIQQTTSNPGLWWSAASAMLQLVQTILLLVSAIAIYFEINRMRRESTQYKVDGLRMALNLLDSPPASKLMAIAMKHHQTIQAPLDEWNRVLQDITIVELMVQKGYADRELLLGLKGDALSALGAYLIREGESLPGALAVDLRSKYASAMRLLKSAMEGR